MLGFTVRSMGAVAGAAALAAAGCMVAGTASAAARPASGTGYSVTGSLLAVVATSADNAWAVGSAGSSSLILRWNGRSWARQSSPKGTLTAVAASSATNAWAVGSAGSSGDALTLHWNGKSWQRVSVPGASGESLAGVATTSASNAWAVGASGTSTLILHWNGKKWSEGPPPAGIQSSVAAPSASDVWTSGCECGGNPGPFDTTHWNGKSWSRPRNPFPGLDNGIDWGEGVVAAAPGVAWAAGLYSISGSDTPFLMRWTGSAWKLTRFAPKKPTLSGLAVTSAGNAWAVGATSAGKTLILHWNGSAWH